MDKQGDSRSRIIATFYCSCSNRVTAPFLGFARKSGTSGDRWESPSFNLSLQPSISTDWDEQSCNSDWEGFFFKKVKPSNPCARGWVIRKRPQKSILWPQMMFEGICSARWDLRFNDNPLVCATWHRSRTSTKYKNQTKQCFSVFPSAVFHLLAPSGALVFIMV